MSNRRPLPLKHSVAYGAPPTDLPSPSTLATSDLGEVTRQVVKDLRLQQKKEQEERHARIRANQRAKVPLIEAVMAKERARQEGKDASTSRQTTPGVPSPKKTGGMAATASDPAPVETNKRSPTARKRPAVARQEETPTPTLKRPRRDEDAEAEARQEQAARDAEVQRKRHEAAARLQEQQITETPARVEDNQSTDQEMLFSPDQDSDLQQDTTLNQEQDVVNPQWLPVDLAEAERMKEATRKRRAEHPVQISQITQAARDVFDLAAASEPTRGETSDRFRQSTLRGSASIEPDLQDPPPTVRSYIEESEIFGKVRVQTPPSVPMLGRSFHAGPSRPFEAPYPDLPQPSADAERQQRAQKVTNAFAQAVRQGRTDRPSSDQPGTYRSAPRSQSRGGASAAQAQAAQAQAAPASRSDRDRSSGRLGSKPLELDPAARESTSERDASRAYRPPIIQPPPHLDFPDQPAHQPAVRRQAENAPAATNFTATAPNTNATTQAQPPPLSPRRQPKTTEEPAPEGWQESWYSRLASDFGHHIRASWAFIRVVVTTAVFWLPILAVVLSLLSAMSMPALNVPTRWYGWTDWPHNLGQFVPGILVPPAGLWSPETYSNLASALARESLNIASLNKDYKITEETVKKLEGLLPQLLHVKMDAKTGKPKISQDFWHALKDYMQKDKGTITLDESTGDISDSHWKILLGRLQKAGFSNDPTKIAKNLSPQIERFVDETLPRSFESWLKDNQQKVTELLQKASPKPDALPKVVEENLLSKAEKLIQKQFSSGELGDRVVSKKEFIGSLDGALASQKKELDDKFGELRVELEKTVAKASRNTSSPVAGLSKTDVQKLIDDTVRDAISDAQLAAAARSQITSHFDETLRQQVNFFGVGNGAIVNSQLSSPGWVPEKPPLFSRVWRKTMANLPRFQHERGAALVGWTDAGHCWCADSASQPARLVVETGQTIIPQHLVLEHIDPAATIDPDSMPKDLEVWAMVDDSLLARAKDFEFAHFPNTDKGQPLAAKGFVKIGEFTYRHSRKDNGIQVYKFSDELLNMKATVDQLAIIARTNHGATDHTCFYRVRLYGKPHEYELD